MSVTVTLGSHIFAAAPGTVKRLSLIAPILEIIDGVDKVQYMGRINKEITLTTTELSKTAIDDLRASFESEEELAFNVPSFEENKTCRMMQFDCKEVEAVPATTYYEVTITVVFTV